jgi:hypothetical protein
MTLVKVANLAALFMPHSHGTLEVPGCVAEPVFPPPESLPVLRGQTGPLSCAS